MIYRCSNCKGKVTISHAGQGTKQRGLGTWRCQNGCAYARRISVKRDLSGGKESERDRRQGEVIALRHVRVERGNDL